MKKVFMAACAALAIFAVSCSSSPEDKAVSIIEKATEQVESAKSASDVMSASMDAAKELVKLEEGLTKEEKETI